MLPIEITALRPDLEREIAASGAELIEIQFRRLGSKSTLTFIIDKDGGVTLEDCVRVNKQLGAFFDARSAESNGPEQGSVLRGSYNLEVNSPGLDRPLKTDRDFRRAVGENVKVVFRNEKGFSEVFIGILEAVAEGVIELAEPAGTRRKFTAGEILRANREIGFAKH